MRHCVFGNSDTYPIALLIKAAAFSHRELEAVYAASLKKHGIDPGDLIAVAAPYDDNGKAPAPFIKSFLAELMPNLASVGTKIIYCADAAYFKVLTGAAKAEPQLGYCLPCKLAGYEHIDVVLGVNHKSLVYNPANEAKLNLSLETLASVRKGNYQGLGANVLHNAEYPRSYSEIKTALQRLHQYPELSCDIEAFSLDFDKAGIGTISFAWSQHDGIAFACDYEPLLQPINGEYGRYVPNPEIRGLIHEFLGSYKGRLRYHRSNYDVKVLIYNLWMKDLLDRVGMLDGLDQLCERMDDTRIIAYLATNTCGGNSLGLKDLAHEHAGNWAVDEIKDIRRIPLPKLLTYNLVDAVSTNYTFDKYYPVMVADQQLELYQTLMLDSLKVILQMELTGMPLNPKRVQEVKAELTADVEKHTATVLNSKALKNCEVLLKQRAWEKDYEDRKFKAKNPEKIKPKDFDTYEIEPFNFNSGPQTQVLLYDVMCLPVIDTTDTGQPAVGGETLEKLINHTDNAEYKAVIEALIGYAQANKILGTFIAAFEQAIEKGDCIAWLHGNFNLGGTKSGRMSSSDPNLQNLPAGNSGSETKQHYGKLVKSCFQAPNGWLFCGADFNSLEDYISALTTKDPNKLKVYIEGYDGHCLRAFSYFGDEMPGIVDTVESINSIKKLYKEMRQASKAPTFALTYQGTFSTLMNNLGWSEEKAKKIEANYHELYKVSDQWVQARLDEAAQCGYVTIAFGLRLRTPLLKQSLRGSRRTPKETLAEGRTAGNALGQSYGLLTNRACNAFMKRVWASQYRYDIFPVAQIHDAIYLVIRDDVEVVEWVNRVLIEEMRWQELPEIQHEVVKIGAELSIFWPSWADELTIPNGADTHQIRKLCDQHIQKRSEKLAA